jgi:hypothetical protein
MTREARPFENGGAAIRYRTAAELMGNAADIDPELAGDDSPLLDSPLGPTGQVPRHYVGVVIAHGSMIDLETIIFLGFILGLA